MNVKACEAKVDHLWLRILTGLCGANSSRRSTSLGASITQDQRHRRSWGLVHEGHPLIGLLAMSPNGFHLASDPTKPFDAGDEILIDIDQSIETIDNQGKTALFSPAPTTAQKPSAGCSVID